MAVAVCRSDAVDLCPASSKIWQMRLDPVQRCAANTAWLCCTQGTMSDWRWRAVLSLPLGRACLRPMYACVGLTEATPYWSYE